MRMVVDATTGDLTDDALNWTPPGTANSVGANFLHLVSGEDLFVQMLLQGRPMEWETGGWGARLGLATPPGSEDSWAAARSATLSVAPIRDYQTVVRAATDAYVAGLDDAAFDRVVELFGQEQTLADALGLMVAHTVGHSGDISAVKGMQGLKGLPF